MFRLLLTFAAFLLVSSTAMAAPHVPTRGAMKGDIVKMNQQFHLTGYNYRIAKIHWVSADNAFAQAVSSYAATTTPGVLVFEVPVKNTQSESDFAPELTITALYKDGTQADSDGHPYSAAGAIQNNRKIFPGQGATFYYAVGGVPAPTNGNPVVKLILKYAANNDPGYPPVYRLLQPVVSKTP